jgi:hypothetical protein
MRAFEYLNTYVDAVESSGTYQSQLVEEQLNKLGQEGWELVNMTPDWVWEYETISQQHDYYSAEFGSPGAVESYYVDAPYSEPDYIAGWYCTFKGSLS